MTFDEAFNRLMKYEGGYSNNPNDPGGETKYGISKAAYPDLDIRNLTIEQAKDIYFKEFWQFLPALPDKLDYAVFDFAVNSGTQTATRYLQRVLGVADDGYFGPVSQKALENSILPFIYKSYNLERMRFMTKLKDFNTFGRGWISRVLDIIEDGSN